MPRLAAGCIRLASGISFLVDPVRANRLWGDPDEPVATARLLCALDSSRQPSTSLNVPLNVQMPVHIFSYTRTRSAGIPNSRCLRQLQGISRS